MLSIMFVEVGKSVFTTQVFQFLRFTNMNISSYTFYQVGGILFNSILFHIKYMKAKVQWVSNWSNEQIYAIKHKSSHIK